MIAMKTFRMNHFNVKARLLRLFAAGLLITLACLPFQHARAAAMRLYVKPDGSGAKTCLDWVNACTLLHALSLTVPVSGYEVWVFKGIYKPTDDGNRSATFQLKNKMALYGGFDGDEVSRSDANWKIDQSTLSGDIGIEGDITDNSYHVVTGNNTDATAALDGFWITGGNANTGSDYMGGGMFNSVGNPTLMRLYFSQNNATYGGGMYNSGGSRPDMGDITFYQNSANGGGGMYNFNAYPQMNYVIFDSNNASTAGGGMQNEYCVTPAYHIDLTGVTFSGNSAISGGGMRNSDCNPIIQSSIFINNHAFAGGGGGMENYHSSPTLKNVTFTGNTAMTTGGGMYNRAVEPQTSDPWLYNVTFYGNAAPTGNSISNNRSNMVVENSILWGNTGPGDTQIYSINSIPVVGYSDVEGGWAGEGNINADPLLGSLGTYQGNTQVYPLLPGSPAIDTGYSNNGLCPSTDQRGIGRPQGNQCDMGAYEARPFTLASLSGDHQWAYTLAQFNHPLVITVTGVDDDPVEGGKIYFSLPVSGPGAAPASASATITGGQASMTFTANVISGSYHIFFHTTGGGNTVDFHLSNVLNPALEILYLPLILR
jgi:hypothetical protein